MTEMTPISHTDRLGLTALAVADVGIGIFLIAVGTLPTIPIVHTIVGVIACLLAFPAATSAITGRLPGLADEGMLVNVGVMTFMTFEIMSLPAQAGQQFGLGTFVLAAAFATIGLYLRLFGAMHLRPKGRRVAGSTTTSAGG